ncbi:MAG: hypothetical protein ACR2OZ_06585 [Verrucomicrobiales bacterium]
MRVAVTFIFLSVLVSLASARDFPKQIRDQLRGDIRRAFLNITFSASTQKEEDQKVNRLIAHAFGGGYFTVDEDDADIEFQVTVTDGAGMQKRSVSFVYNQSENGWVLLAALPGGAPIGSPAKHHGWRDIHTRERIFDRPSEILVRTYRYINGAYVKIGESVDSGG